jgi:putative SOS response-associated peptidase YedK
MCFTNTLTANKDGLKQRYSAKTDLLIDHKPTFFVSGFSYPAWPIITNEFNNTFQTYSWGLIPNWAKDKQAAWQLKAMTLNAKSETIFDKPSFKALIGYKRCLVPSTGFIEWQHVAGNKIPYYIFLKNKAIFSMAGVWDIWVDSFSGITYQTFSILTTQANTLMANIHNTKQRMPVILSAEQEQQWLRKQLSKGDCEALMRPYDTNKMEAYTISKLVSSKTENANQPAALEKYIYAPIPKQLGLF